LANLAGSRPAWFADTLVHPHEHVYTPATLVALAEECGLRFAGFTDPHLWTPGQLFADAGQQAALGALPPVSRAEVITRLLGEAAPFLELYLAKADAVLPEAADDATLLAGRVEPRGPMVRRELDDALRPGPPTLLEPEVGPGGTLRVRAGRGQTVLPALVAELLDAVGEGIEVAELVVLTAPLLADLPSQRRLPTLLRLLRVLLGPEARLLLFLPSP
jgi:hypothetical protein